MLNGFMIFLTATAWPVSWSLAELQRRRQHEVPRDHSTMRPCWGPANPSTGIGIGIGISIPHQAKGSHPHGLQVGVPISPSTTVPPFHRSPIPPPSLFSPRRGSDLLVISKVVPNIWARTNSAMMPWAAGAGAGAVVGAGGHEGKRRPRGRVGG